MSHHITIKTAKGLEVTLPAEAIGAATANGATNMAKIAQLLKLIEGGTEDVNDMPKVAGTSSGCGPVAKVNANCMLDVDDEDSDDGTAIPDCCPVSVHGPFISIIVEQLTGKIIHVTLPFGARVRLLKSRIQDVEGIPPDQQRIMFAGKQLSDRMCLKHSGVKTGSLVKLVLRLRGS